MLVVAVAAAVAVVVVVVVVAAVVGRKREGVGQEGVAEEAEGIGEAATVIEGASICSYSLYVFLYAVMSSIVHVVGRLWW